MKSMTGFGVGESTAPTGRLVVEVRAVNHRFLDVRVRVPRELIDLSTFAEQLGRERLGRGRVEIAIRVEGASPGGLTLNLDRARAVYRAFAALRDELAPGTELPVGILASVPELFASTTDGQQEAIRVACREAFDRAVRSLEAMRADEGATLARDLACRLGNVRRSADQITARAPQLLELYGKRLRGRIARFLGADAPVDALRVEQEIALLADRSDVTEELARLGSHCQQFESLLDDKEAVGRRLDFLLQEMVREVNTIGAKAQDADVAHLVVAVKSELERMREQVQNVE